MAHLFQSLLLLVATASKNELARQIKYLKVENEILRSKLPGRITVTGKERSRLVRFAQKLGTAIRGLATIVSPETVLRWIREEREGKHQPPSNGSWPNMGSTQVPTRAKETGMSF